MAVVAEVVVWHGRRVGYTLAFHVAVLIWCCRVNLILQPTIKGCTRLITRRLTLSAAGLQPVVRTYPYSKVCFWTGIRNSMAGTAGKGGWISRRFKAPGFLLLLLGMRWAQTWGPIVTRPRDLGWLWCGVKHDDMRWRTNVGCWMSVGEEEVGGDRPGRPRFMVKTPFLPTGSRRRMNARRGNE
jgi:hypothetical protein